MKPLKRIILPILVGFVVAVTVYSAAQSLLYYPLLRIQNRIDDSHFTVRSRIKPSDTGTADRIVIVDIDDRTLEEIGKYTRSFPRIYFGRVISNVKNDGARLIFLDVLLRGMDSYADNKSLADSIKNADNVLSGFYVNLDHRSKKKATVGFCLQ